MSLEPGTPDPDGSASGVAGVTGIGADESPCANPRFSLLLLEDDEALRQMLAWELSELGYRVRAVGSCGEARAAMLASNYDVALVDIGLPDGNGAELAAELIDLSPAVRIALCSGRPGAPDCERLPANVVASLTKPISIPGIDALFRGSA